MTELPTRRTPVPRQPTPIEQEGRRALIERLIQQRGRLGITLEQLAHDMTMRRDRLEAWELDCNRTIPLVTLYWWARTLHMHLVIRNPTGIIYVIPGRPLGDVLRNMRSRAGITREQAAKKVGVGVPTLIQWEYGQSAASTTLIGLLHILGAELDLAEETQL